MSDLYARRPVWLVRHFPAVLTSFSRITVISFAKCSATPYGLRCAGGPFAVLSSQSEPLRDILGFLSIGSFNNPPSFLPCAPISFPSSPLVRHRPPLPRCSFTFPDYATFVSGSFLSSDPLPLPPLTEVSFSLALSSTRLPRTMDFALFPESVLFFPVHPLSRFNDPSSSTWPPLVM